MIMLVGLYKGCWGALFLTGMQQKMMAMKMNKCGRVDVINVGIYQGAIADMGEKL